MVGWVGGRARAHIHETIEVLVVTQGSAAVTSRSDTSCCTERHGAIVVCPVIVREKEGSEIAFVNVRLAPPHPPFPCSLSAYWSWIYLKKSTKRRKEGQETGSSHRLLLMQSLENLIELEIL